MFFGAGSSRARSDELNSASVPMRHQLDRCFEKAFVRARDAAAFDSIPLVNRDPSSGEGAACGVRLEPENDAGVVAAVTFVCVAMGEVVAEPGQHKIKLRRPDCNGFAQRNIESPIWGLPINELYASGPCRPLIRYPSEANLSVIFRSKVE